MSEVLVRTDGRVRWIVLNRPESRNGLTIEVNQALIEALRAAGTDDTVRAIALTGSGGSFCSGLDLKAAAAAGVGSPQEIEERMRTYFHGLIRAVRAVPKPVVAVVDGSAAGFGCDLALACDLRFCSDRARFGEVFVKRGLMPDGGGTFHLARIIGLGRAMEMLLTGDNIDAQEAHRIGLANRVVPFAELEAAAGAYCAKLAAGAPLVHKLVKQHAYGALSTDLDAALENEAKGQLQLLQSQDFFEGVSSFLQKRDPQFKGQ
jgi:2-(1,2-epoxy-1,2-dihydrophenyl)acetyl-CoA isomerase